MTNDYKDKWLPLEKQVVNLDLSKQLAELLGDTAPESLFSWLVASDGARLMKNPVASTYKYFDQCPAYTTAELGEMLPEYSGSYRIKGGQHQSLDGDRCKHKEIADTEADARAKMLVYLLKSMKTHKERVQEYVREQIPDLRELSFGCEVVKGRNHYTVGCNVYGDTFEAVCEPSVLIQKFSKEIEIIGHPIQLHHYLAVLGKVQGIKNIQISTKKMTVEYQTRKYLYFSLTSGQPATEKDWEIMSNLLGV